MIVTGELHGEVAGEPIGALDNDGAHAVGGDRSQHAGEAESRSHWIRCRAPPCHSATRRWLYRCLWHRPQLWRAAAFRYPYRPRHWRSTSRHPVGLVVSG
jgi:hypothetical protein